MDDVKDLIDKLSAKAKTHDDVAEAYNKNGEKEQAQFHYGYARGFRQSASMVRGDK